MSGSRATGSRGIGAPRAIARSGSSRSGNVRVGGARSGTTARRATASSRFGSRAVARSRTGSSRAVVGSRAGSSRAVVGTRGGRNLVGGGVRSRPGTRSGRVGRAYHIGNGHHHGGHHGYYYRWHHHHHFGYGYYPYWNIYPNYGLYFGFGLSYYGPRYRTVFVDAEPYYGAGEGEIVEEVIYEDAPAEEAQPLEEGFPPAEEAPADEPQPAAGEPSDEAAPQEAPRKPHADFEPSVQAFLAGDYEQALTRLGRVVADEPDNGEAWLAIMHANFALGRYAPSGEALAKAGELQAFPRGYRFDPRPLYAKQAGSFDTYVKALDDHIAKSPKDADAELVRAYLHVMLGERAEARDAIDRVLEIRPADETAPALALALLPPPPPPVKGGPVAPPAKPTGK